MNEQIRKKLKSLGIELNCESPLEISHPEMEANASGYMAQSIINQAMNGDFDENYEPIEPNSLIATLPNFPIAQRNDDPPFVFLRDAVEIKNIWQKKMNELAARVAKAENKVNQICEILFPH